MFDRLRTKMNQNEALNNTLWAKCPKLVFVGKTKIGFAVVASVLLWNKGAGIPAFSLLTKRHFHKST